MRPRALVRRALGWARDRDARRFAGLVAIFVRSGLVVTWLVPPTVPADPGSPPPPPLRVADVVVPTNGDMVANALDLVRRYAAGEITIKLPDGSGRTLKRGALGAEIDRVRLAEFVKQVQQADSAVRRAHDARSPDAPLEVPLPVIVDADVAIGKLLQIKSELDGQAMDAYVDLTSRTLKPEKIGHRLDVYGTLARVDAAFRRGEGTVEADVETVQPKLVAGQLGNVKFDQVLGYFETRHSQGEKYKDRTYNLRLAASKL